MEFLLPAAPCTDTYFSMRIFIKYSVHNIYFLHPVPLTGHMSRHPVLPPSIYCIYPKYVPVLALMVANLVIPG